MIRILGWALIVIGALTKEEPTATTLFHLGVIFVLFSLMIGKQERRRP